MTAVTGVAVVTRRCARVLEALQLHKGEYCDTRENSNTTIHPQLLVQLARFNAKTSSRAKDRLREHHGRPTNTRRHAH